MVSINIVWGVSVSLRSLSEILPSFDFLPPAPPLFFTYLYICIYSWPCNLALNYLHRYYGILLENAVVNSYYTLVH